MSKLLNNIGSWARANAGRFLVILGGLALALWILIETFIADNMGLNDKTLWDWLELMIVPAVLAIGVWWLNRVEKRTEIKIAEDRIQAERKIANTKLQEDALQAYLDRMTSLLIDSNLRESASGSEARSIARSRTLTVVRSLDGTRKGLLLRFLYESELINKDTRVIKLRGAELDESELERANLRWSDISWSNLRRSNLTKALLHGSNLAGAQLGNANLTDARLAGANLRMATLSEAILVRTDLNSADLQDSNLSKAVLHKGFCANANFRGAKLMDCDLSDVDLRGADLTRAILDDSNLNKANLEGAILVGASLRNTNLIDASLDNADLSLVNLSGAQLDSQQLKNVRSLVVAVMPDGNEV